MAVVIIHCLDCRRRKTKQVADHLATELELEGYCNECQANFKQCESCAEVLEEGDEGFVFYDGGEYYCSETCRREKYTDEQYRQLFMDEQAYFTTMESTAVRK